MGSLRTLRPVLGLALSSFAVAATACSFDSSVRTTPAHQPFPNVPTLDGALLSPMKLVTIVSDGDEDAAQLFDYSKGVGSSTWWHRVASEYGLSTLESIAEITGPPIDADVTDHDVFSYITDAVTANGGPARDGNTLYLLYLPASVTLIADGKANTDCQDLGAYHARYGTRGDNLAVVQRCDPLDPVRSMISASHEIIEAATDPDLRGYALPTISREPWKDDIWNAFELQGLAELADLCQGTYYLEGEWYYQRIWSNVAAAAGGDPCIPEIPDPFYDTTFEHDWYAIEPGKTVSIPATGWATGSMPDWRLDAFIESNTPGFDVGTAPTLASGGTATVTVTAPAGAQSGTFAVVNVASLRPSESFMIDGEHINLVGVYVP